MTFQDTHLRTIGAKLTPAATIGSKGLSESLIHEVDSRLRDHELIKVRSQLKDKMTNTSLFTELGNKLDARLVQVIGRTALLLRYADEQTPVSSNLHIK